MKITVVKSEEVEITRCNDCPYKTSTMDGMECTHPDIPKSKLPYAGMIISHPECDTGFPVKCPLVKLMKVNNKYDNPVIIDRRGRINKTKERKI